MERPTHFKERYINKVKAWLAEGKSVGEFAHFVGVGRNTVYLWIRRYPEFRKACEDGRKEFKNVS